MGMTIDKTIEFFNGLECHTPQAKDARDMAIETMHKYQMLQTDYEERLKADMAAMLEDLDLQIDESAAYNLEVAKVQRLIRDKINKLMEKSC